MNQTQYLCVHCHFYQPPRGNPFSRKPVSEPDAAPYPNWNARIAAECYRPNADSGNFELISFNIGETLMGWLAENEPATYQKILAADASSTSVGDGIGNGVAQPFHHTILPLSRREDKVTQVAWGKAAFAHRFGRETSGLWLPEMAVDMETLEVLVDQGIAWTILSDGQVSGKPQGAGPFWITLPGGKRITVFVRDNPLSNDIAFSLGRFGGAGRWAHEVLAPRKRDAGPLTLIASDGETFGHHWPGEEQFLHWLLSYEGLAAGYQVTTLSAYARMVTPQVEITLKENSSWSCQHGLARWATGCSCTPGESFWKGAIRRAMDNLQAEIDGLYESEAAELGVADHLSLRDAYIRVILGITAAEKFLDERGVSVQSDRAARLLKLIEAQYYRQCMFASCTWFFADLDAHTTRYGIANAAYAIRLMKEATGVDLADNFRRDLRIAEGREIRTGQRIDGGHVFDELMSSFAEGASKKK